MIGNIDILEFISAVLIPVAASAGVIALVIDLFLKRIPGWTSAATVRANVGLNLAASAALFFARRAGVEADFFRAFLLAETVLPIVGVLVFGPSATWLQHKWFQTIGLSPGEGNPAGIVGPARAEG